MVTDSFSSHLNLYFQGNSFDKKKEKKTKILKRIVCWYHYCKLISGYALSVYYTEKDCSWEQGQKHWLINKQITGQIRWQKIQMYICLNL